MTYLSEEDSWADEEEDIEIQKDIKEFLDEKTAALCFIGPYIPAKVTPTKQISASISIPEELMIEDAITELKKNNIENLIILLNSLGGDISSSYKIAKALRKNFKDISVFIPHIAASGGTLIALTGNRIIMGDMSNISPIDVQVDRNGGRVSVNAMLRSFHNLNNVFSKKHESDVPYPYKAMADKLDPVEFQEWVDTSGLMEQHAEDIMTHENGSLNKKSKEIIKWLSTDCPTHSYSITFGEALKNLGDDYLFHCTDKKYAKIWPIMRSWVRKYIMKESGTHFVAYILICVI